MAIEKTVPEGSAGRRVEYVAEELFEALPSRTRARKALKAGRLAVNGTPVGTGWVVQAGDLLRLDPPPPPSTVVFEHPLDVVYEDDHIAVVRKPAGLQTSGTRFRTLNQCLPHNLSPSPLEDALGWPRAVHRLDGRTEGLVVVAKASNAEVHISRAFERREVHKWYRAMCIGVLEGAGRVESPIDGRAAASRYVARAHTPSKRLGWLTLVHLFPETGRTHQLRRHVAELGHPIVGDDLYGLDDNIHRKGLMLQAAGLRFAHPITGAVVEVALPLPRKFERLWDWERQGWWLQRRAGDADGEADADADASTVGDASPASPEAP